MNGFLKVVAEKLQNRVKDIVQLNGIGKSTTIAVKEGRQSRNWT